MDIRILREYLERTPRDKLKNLEEALLRITKYPLSSGINNRLSRTVRRIFKREYQSYMDEFYSKRKPISSIEEIRRNRKALKSIDEASINLITYRPANIVMLLEEEEKFSTMLAKEIEKLKKSGEMSGKRVKEIFSKRKVSIPGCYFKRFDYHDSLSLKICHAVEERNIEEIEHLLEMGFEHVVWSNICEASLNRIIDASVFFPEFKKLKKIVVEPYPEEFFAFLVTLDTNLQLLKEVPYATEQILNDLVIVGGYRRIGNHLFNEQKLRNKCREYLLRFPFHLRRLIEDYYLDRQIEVYNKNLKFVTTLVQSYVLKERLKKLEEDIESVVSNLPTHDPKEFWSIWYELREDFENVRPSTVMRKGELEKPYSTFWSLAKRRSLDYTAATILLECLCQIQHDFPAERWIKFKYLNQEQAKNYRFLEIPTEESYKYLAKIFELSARKLRNYHEGTMFVCRHF